VACCTVGLDKDPNAELRKKKDYSPKITAAFAPGMGFYGGSDTNLLGYGAINV